MTLRLKLDYKQTCSTAHQSTTIKIEEWQRKTIQDVKNTIETTLSIPCCDQRLFYPQEHPITDDSVELKSLYLRDGDEIFLEFLSVININGMNEFIDDLLKFAGQIDQWNEENIFDINTDTNPPPNYDIITRATERLAFEYFLPWKNPVSVAQRHYFVQKGAFDKFLEVFKFAQHRYSCTHPDPDVKPYVLQHFIIFIIMYYMINPCKISYSHTCIYSNLNL